MILPIKHRILIQRDAIKTEVNGLHIPESAQKKEVYGTILEIGSEADKDLKKGQRVLFGLHDGFAIDSDYCDGLTNCWMIADNQVRAIINE